jgi:hypothetical protein
VKQSYHDHASRAGSESVKKGMCWKGRDRMSRPLTYPFTFDPCDVLSLQVVMHAHFQRLVRQLDTIVKTNLRPLGVDMRLSTTAVLSTLLLTRAIQAGVFGGDSSSDSGSASATSSGSTPTNSASAEVAFLQTLQAAQISSMSCLITLVNMTANPVGSCLGLTTLSQLIVNPSQSTRFSDGLSNYLSTACGASQCSDDDISEAKAQIQGDCEGSQGTELIQVLSAVLDNYSTSYRTLACSVHL